MNDHRNNNNNRRGGYNNNNYNGGYNRSNDKEPKKDWRKRTTHQPNGLPKNLRVEIPVSCYGITKNGKEYDGTSFIDLMEDLQNNSTFSKISIPVYMPASYVNDNPEAKWNTIIGYIKEFSETGDATIVVYAKSIKVFQKIADPIIVPRVAIKDGVCTCIIGLDIIDRNDIKK